MSFMVSHKAASLSCEKYDVHVDNSMHYLFGTDFIKLSTFNRFDNKYVYVCISTNKPPSDV